MRCGKAVATSDGRGVTACALLVTGGAGYIGSVVTEQLLRAGYSSDGLRRRVARRCYTRDHDGQPERGCEGPAVEPVARGDELQRPVGELRALRGPPDEGRSCAASPFRRVVLVRLRVPTSPFRCARWQECRWRAYSWRSRHLAPP